jgi:hypothetical protein
MSSTPAWLESLDLVQLKGETDEPHYKQMTAALRKPQTVRFRNASTSQKMSKSTSKKKKGVPVPKVTRHGTKRLVAVRTTIGQKIWHEIYLLICTDDAKYAAERKAFATTKGRGTPAIMAVLAVSVADKFGLTAAACAPYVAAGLMCVVKIGKEVVCQRLTPSRLGSGAKSDSGKKNP